jgi:arsenate reductase (glutaredoxin)
MIKLYGIKNCDTMKKAFTWLDKNRVEYSFHDYKQEGIDAGTIQRWMKKIPVDKLINTKGPTFRKLTDQQKASIKDPSAAIKLMLENTSMIKRPLLTRNNDPYLLGFNEADWTEALKK